MKILRYTSFFLVLVAVLIACEDPIDINVGETESLVVVDAWIDNRPATQTINITYSRSFYDEGDFEGITASEVRIEDLTDPSEPDYEFTQIEAGVYQWVPTTELDSFGMVGHEYRLSVVIDDLSFEALSILNPVPKVDSIRFNYEEENLFLDEYYQAEFFATDLEGLGNTYWIKGYKNGVFLDQPEYITTSYDGAFSESTQDGILFIPPLRYAINPFEDAEDGDGVEPAYLVGDSTGVEVHGITGEAFLYLNEIQTQTDRQGGISELFSVPMTNLTGNIVTVSGDVTALGFFSTSTVEMAGLKLTEELAAEARDRD